MTIYDQIHAACQPYWQVRANELHIPVAYAFAQQLLAQHPTADPAIVLPAILLHDNGYAQVPEALLFQGLADAPIGFNPDITRLHEIEGVKIARAILTALNFDAEKTELICTIIDGHDSRLVALSLEDALVKDADKLWRFSAIGVQTSSSWMSMAPLPFLDYCLPKINTWFFTDTAKTIARQVAEKTRVKLTVGQSGEIYTMIQGLENKVVIVTGGAGGLGRAFALAFAEAGARVVCADLNLAGAEESVALIAQQGGQALALSLNVVDEVSTEAMAASVIGHWGVIDVLVNNAAIYAGLQRRPFWEIAPEEWDRVMAVNLKGPWLCTKAIFPYMRQRGGKIINISSATAFSGSPNWLHYVAGKSGVLGMTRAMARELGEHNITVNAVAPGFTLTDASMNLVENAVQYGVDRGVIKRNAQTDDIVGTALYLASPLSDFVTGQTIIVDGGRQFN